jgi:IS605 OrfB family transposase
MIVDLGGKTEQIGSSEEFLHRRLAIQAALKRLQVASKYNKGGKGIQKKIAAINSFKDKEVSYVKARIHKYSAELIKLCIKHRIGNIVLVNIKEVKKETKKEEFLLRNWSYYGLSEKIKYKANKYNIEVVEQEMAQEK